MSQTPSTVRLRAIRGLPLEDAAVRSTVIATAHAIAERVGVPLIALETAPDSIIVTLAADRLSAIGFLAELRRTTNAWYEGKFRDGPLWVTGSDAE